MTLSIRATQILRQQQREKLEAKLKEEQERKLALEEWGRLTIPAAQVARQLKISRRTLQRWVKAGRLTPVRLGETDQSRLFFCRVEVEQLLGRATNKSATTTR